MKISTPSLPLDVLQQFRVIYGTMRQYFRLVEQCCGLPGSQMWILQEVERTPAIGVTELAQRLGIHQSTCSQLVERLVGLGYLEKQKAATDRRRVGLV
ncbi:MAG: MarR family transcriptional regulator, partial [Dechloromonas sp.]|nr:MarR family transcriptional regulator [Dechloromonas sp.]